MIELLGKMQTLVCVLLGLRLVFLSSASSSTMSVVGDDFTVYVNLSTSGDYNISLDKQAWLLSAPIKLHLDGAWYSSNPKSDEEKLVLNGSSEDTGTDPFGEWQSMTWRWKAKTTPFVTTVKTYPKATGLVGGVVLFEQVFPEGATGVSVSDHERPLACFPSFWTTKGSGMFGKLGYLTFHGGMSRQILTGMYDPGFGGSESSQIALIAEDLTTVMLSPLDGFMVHIMNGKDDTLNAGVGGEFDPLPEKFTIRTILYASKGVRDTFRNWGKLLLQWHGKEPTSTQHDIFTSSLGYSTTGYYFYNPCDGTALPNCSNYEDTLLQVHDYSRRVGIPYRYYLLDSWWYGEDIYHGVSEWEDIPSLVGERFPHGLKYLSEKLQVPFKCHNGKWSSSTPYANPSRHLDFLKESDGVIPYGPELWEYLFGKNNEWGMKCIKQDHISEQVQMRAVHTNVTLATDWLLGQGTAAADNNVTIQYCMTFPSITLNSVTVKASTHQRLGTDYLPRLAEQNWNIGAQSILVYSVGLLPYKDTFFSSSKEVPTSSRFKGYSEKASKLHAVVSILSAGPVAPSDGVNGSDVELIRRMHRDDGLLLKPDFPAMSVDATWSRRIFDDLKGPDGELWTTYTGINVAGEIFTIHLTWGYVFASSLKNNVTLTLSQLHLDLPDAFTGLVYEMDSNPLTFTAFNASMPLHIQATGTDYGQFRLLYTVPTLAGNWHFLGEMDKIVPVSKTAFHQ